MAASLVDTKSQSILTDVKHSPTILSMNKAGRLYEESQRRIKQDQELKNAKRGDWPLVIVILVALTAVALAVYIPKAINNHREQQQFNQMIEQSEAQ
jgi:hypothetical protein